MNRKPLLNNEYYHICNRGVIGVEVLKDVKDHLHFLSCLKEFNTDRNVEFRILKTSEPISRRDAEEHELVEIISYCLQPKHYHLILKQKKNNGIALFMQKIGTGYTMYYNSRYSSNGHIFQGKFLSQHIPNSDFLLFMTSFIHLHPLKRKEEQLFNLKLNKILIIKLSTYVWSSMPDYMNNTAIYIDLPELKYVKPHVNIERIQSILQNEAYDSYILNNWGKKYVKIGKKYL